MRQETASGRDVLTEWQLSTVGKLFLAGIGAWLLGRAAHLIIKGKKQQIDALRTALVASRKFQDILKRPNVTVDQILDKLREKDATAREWEKKTKTPWPF